MVKNFLIKPWGGVNPDQPLRHMVFNKHGVCITLSTVNQF